MSGKRIFGYVHPPITGKKKKIQAMLGLIPALFIRIFSVRIFSLTSRFKALNSYFPVSRTFTGGCLFSRSRKNFNFYYR